MGGGPAWLGESKLRPQGLRLSIPHSRARKEGVEGGAAAVRMETPSGGELPPGAVGVGERERN